MIDALIIALHIAGAFVVAGIIETIIAKIEEYYNHGHPEVRPVRRQVRR